MIDKTEDPYLEHPDCRQFVPVVNCDLVYVTAHKSVVPAIIAEVTRVIF
ncbi:MAG: hypothetical protein PVF26_17150 [Desulfobacterales bacterium]